MLLCNGGGGEQKNHIITTSYLRVHNITSIRNNSNGNLMAPSLLLGSAPQIAGLPVLKNYNSGFPVQLPTLRIVPTVLAGCPDS